MDELQSDARLRNVPVLIVAGSINDENVQQNLMEFLSKGAHDFISKDAELGILHTRIRNCLQRKQYQDQLSKKIDELRDERQRAVQLLGTLLPEQAVRAIYEGDAEFNPQIYRSTAVLACRLVNFAHEFDERKSQDVVAGWNQLAVKFEELCETNQLEVIRLGGGSLLATAGMSRLPGNPVKLCVLVAVGLAEAAKSLFPNRTLHTGIDFGSVIAGMTGRNRRQFDIWGQTVNGATALQEGGERDQILLSENAWSEIAKIASGRIVPQKAASGPQRPAYVFSQFVSH